MGNHLQLINFSKCYFVASNSMLFNVEGYKKFEFKHKSIYYTEDFNHFSDSILDFSVFVLGHIVDVRDSQKKLKNIVSDLLQHTIDSEAFLNEMSYFNGAYAIFIEDKEKLYFYNDATSFLSLYYHHEKNIYASHSEILHQLLQQIYNIEEATIHPKMKGFLDLSKYENIYKFNSNFRFELNNHTLKRIFPINIYKEIATSNVVKQVLPLMKEMVEFIFNLDRSVVVSLTGGYDSRLTLALLKKHIPDTLFFTYLKTDDKEMSEAHRKIYQNDYTAVKYLVDQLNLKHKFFSINKTNINEEVKNLYSYYESDHSKYIIQHYSEDPRFQNVAHIKSTLFELSKGVRPPKLEGQESKIMDFVLYLKRWSQIKDEQWIEKVLNEFITRNEINEFLEKGYHPYDILYLESRMNGWHSTILQESDPYMEVYNLINCRYILFSLINMNYEARKNMEFHTSIINESWPLLQFFGINTNVNLYDKYLDLKKQFKPQSETDEINKLQLEYLTSDFVKENEAQSIQLKLSHAGFNREETYKINIVNHKEENVKIAIRTFYKNEKGRGKIFLHIDSKKYDIVDLGYEHVEMFIPPHSQTSIVMQSTQNIDKKSWINAAILQIKEIHLCKKVIE